MGRMRGGKERENAVRLHIRVEKRFDPSKKAKTINSGGYRHVN